jgi:hypothetical protein
VLPWEELVSFAMDFWEQADIEAALGADVAEALPELLRLADLEVRIPRLEVVALENWQRGMGSRSIRCWRGSCAISRRRSRIGWRRRSRDSRRRWRGRISRYSR